MQLSYSPTSPFARKVRVVAHECGLSERVTPVLVETDWRAAHPSLAHWYADFAARPSMIETAPRAE